jgi:hypothetical protein
MRIRRVAENGGALRPGWTGCYGTIIRTRLITEGGHDRLSVAVRFDSHQHFDELLETAGRA